MSEWIDVGVYAAFIAAVWGWLPAWGGRLAVQVIADRNPDWPADHRQVLRRLAGGRWFRWSCALWGSASLLALVTVQADRGPQWLAFAGGGTRWETLKELNSALLIAGLVYVALWVAVFAWWLRANVPRAARREATLERRTLRDHVPRRWQAGVYAAIALHLTAWVAAALAGRGATPPFWGELAFQFAAAGVLLLYVLAAVNRRPGALDRIFGRDYRRAEVRAAFAAQLIPLLAGSARLYAHVTGNAPEHIDRVLHLALVCSIVTFVLALTAWRRQPGQGRSGGWGRSALPGVVVLVAFVTTQAFAQQPALVTLSDAEVRARLAERVDAHRHSVGMVMGVVEPGGRRVIAYGQRSPADPVPVDGDTVFELASVTKAFTSLLLADAVVRGEVSLTDPVAKYLPPTVRMPERGRAITLHDLATHMSGLPREPDNYQPRDPDNPFADYTVEQLYAFLAGHQLTRDVGTVFDYSNLGAGLLGHVLARRAGVDYDTLVRDRITRPLGMSSTAIVLSPALQARLARGHNLFLEPVPNWDSPTLAGAGALRSSVNDMLTFLAAAVGVAPSPLDRAFALMTSARRSPAPGFDVGLAWGIAKNRGTEIMFVNGRSGGYRTWLGFEPGTRRGVVVLTNADGVVGPDDLGRHVLNPAFPLLANLPTAPAPRRQAQVDAGTLDKVAGRYGLAPDVFLTVSRRDGRTFAQVTGQPPAEIFASSDREFFYKVVDAQLTFEMAADGRVAGVILHQNGAQLRGPRLD